MTTRIAVDLGPTRVSVAVCAGNRTDDRVVRFGVASSMPSAVYFDGRTLRVGADAAEAGRHDPAAYEPYPLERIDETVLLLAGTRVPVGRCLAAVLGRAVSEAAHAAGVGAPAAIDELVLTHPPGWAPTRVRVLLGAAAGLAGRVVAVPAPVATAVRCLPAVDGGQAVAVLDVGALRTDVSVLRRGPDGFRIISTRSDERHGGDSVTDVVELVRVVLDGTGCLDHRGRPSTPVLLVDGCTEVPAAAAQLQRHLGVAALVVPGVERALGALAAVASTERPPPPAPAPSADIPVDPAGRHFCSRVVAAAAGVGVLVCVVVVVAWVRWDGDGEADTRAISAQYARLEVPDDWREIDRSEEDGTARFVVGPDVAGESEPRLVLVQTALTGTPSLADVAGTLSRQLEAPGSDGRYSGFTDAARYADRDVIRYRENPSTGGTVQWFVVVSGGYQLSVGCQSANASDIDRTFDAQCESAVRSVTSSDR